MTVGITIFGIIQRNGLNSRLAEAGGNAPAGAELNADAVLSPEVMGQLPPNVREQITASLADSISNTFLWRACASGAGSRVRADDGQRTSDRTCQGQGSLMACR